MEEKASALTVNDIYSFAKVHYGLKENEFSVFQKENINFLVIPDQLWRKALKGKTQVSESVQINSDGFVTIEESEFFSSKYCCIEHEIEHIRQYRSFSDKSILFEPYPPKYPNFKYELNPLRAQASALIKKTGSSVEAFLLLKESLGYKPEIWVENMLSVIISTACLFEDLDYHVHCGQFQDTYYKPSSIVKALCALKKGCVISSTSACRYCESEDDYQVLLSDIQSEMEEAKAAGKRLGLKVLPFFWINPKHERNYSFFDNLIEKEQYAGFKIHPDAHKWDFSAMDTTKLLDSVCDCAMKHKIPVLIHTGSDQENMPNKFENWFARYQGVAFILAHCKDPEPIIELFSKYPNLLGDVAFCPQDSYEAICNAGFKDRMLFGTDFPITHWYHHYGEEKIDTTVESLTESYKKTLNEMSWFGGEK